MVQGTIPLPVKSVIKMLRLFQTEASATTVHTACGANTLTSSLGTAQKRAEHSWSQYEQNDTLRKVGWSSTDASNAVRNRETELRLTTI